MSALKGFDGLARTLGQAARAVTELDGELAKVHFNPADPSSVEEAIAEMALAIDNKLGKWYGNAIVDQMAEATKVAFEQRILNKAEELKMSKHPTLPSNDSIPEVLGRIRETVSDLRRADYQTYDRHATKLYRLLSGEAIKPITDKLVKDLDLETWLAEGRATQSSMVGSAKLSWPDSEEQQLGLTILLAERFAGDSREALNFAHDFYYNGNKFTANLQHMVSQVFIPFERDFAKYVSKEMGEPVTTTTSLAGTPKYPRRVFIVHGHDGESREAVARFLERLNFEVIILNEQPNKGRAMIDKFEEHADVGFAIVLLTPDDYGAANGEESQKRARQNVILELGYFYGKLGRQRVLALKRGALELPTDFIGVAYEEFDAASAWKQSLARELEAADYEIDWNIVMKKK